VQARARHPTTEHEAAQRRSKLAGKQAATAVQPHIPLRHEPTLETERILMMNFASTQARAKEVAPPTSREEGQAEATMDEPLSASSPLTIGDVDKMYHQLAEIHATATAQLVECARWHRTDSTPSLAQAGTSRPRPCATPSTIRLAPSPPMDFSSQTPLWRRQMRRNEPQVHRQARQCSASVLLKHHV
jgi:hypothetical protein